MNADRFKELLEELDGNSVKTLAEKNARYSQNGDALHNFRSGADIAGGTPAQACWGYLTKHLVALRDMVEKDDFSNREDFLEKCQDTINYIRFLWCIGNDESEKVVTSNSDTFYYVPYFTCDIGKAEQVLKSMAKVLQANGYVTLADYNGFRGGLSMDIDRTIGWFDLNDAKVTTVSWGVYTVYLPSPVALNNEQLRS